MESYNDTIEHLRDELRRIDLLMERAVLQFRGNLRQRADAPYAGLYISDAEIDGLLGGDPAAGSEERITELNGSIGTLTAEINARLEENRREGVPLRLLHLADTFGLNRRELDLIVLALAPEIDTRYQKLYAYVQDDISRKRPTVELALRLFCTTDEERLSMRRLFSDVAPLFSIPLLTRHDDPSERPAPLVNATLKLEERIVEFIAGGDYLESRFAARGSVMRWMKCARAMEDLVLRDETVLALESLISSAAADRRWLCVLEGPVGSGRKSVAEVVCTRLGIAMLVVDAPNLLRGESNSRALVRAVLREARLYGGALYIDGWEDARDENTPAGGAAEAGLLLLDELESFPGLVFIGARSRATILRRLRHARTTIEMPIPDERERVLLWQSTLARLGDTAQAGIDPNRIAGAFRLTGGRILNAIERAKAHTRLRAGEGERISEADLLAGCRDESSGAIISFARRLVPQRGWADLVLPPDVETQLREMCRQVRHRATVYGTWGFRRKLSSGIGTIALFTGTSGTGKTLSAEVIAAELGVDLYRVDLSSIVSKYIGETEKNLEKVFSDAQDSSAILFFDEADALFGKRSEVKDAHDRYANIEVNYLLQRVEEYEGAIILASNLSRNIDAAFVRRLHFSIEFPFPDERYRLEIWRRIFPKSTPLGDDMDMPFLARQFKVAGGNIRNVALSAAFAAADAGTPVRMEHVILGMKREYQKLGRTCERTDFQQYHDLVR